MENKEIIIERAKIDSIIANKLVETLKQLLLSMEETKATFDNNNILSTVVENSDIYEQTLQSELGEENFGIFTRLIEL